MTSSTSDWWSLSIKTTITYWPITRVELIQSQKVLPLCFNCSLVSLRRMKSSFRWSVLSCARSKNTRHLKRPQQNSTCGMASKIYRLSYQETFLIWARRVEAAPPEPQPLWIWGMERQLLQEGVRKRMLKIVKEKEMVRALSALSHLII